ncbi:MAG: hypothetical protein ACK40O_14350 [Allosphingosinicella sp.]
MTDALFAATVDLAVHIVTVMVDDESPHIDIVATEEEAAALVSKASKEYLLVNWGDLPSILHSAGWTRTPASVHDLSDEDAVHLATGWDVGGFSASIEAAQISLPFNRVATALARAFLTTAKLGPCRATYFH